jgi:heat shock protein HtpX
VSKRIILFLLTNVLVVITISIVVRVLGFDAYLTKSGLNFGALMGFCLVWGMAGSFISLFISKYMAKMAYGVEIVDGRGEFAPIYNAVKRLSQKAGIPMPEVGVYISPEVNAFATGPSKSNSLVAVSSGLLQRMNSQEVEGVLAHEVAHIANGDMVTMTLIQGVVNAFGMFLARVIGYLAGSALGSGDDDERRPNFLVQFAVTLLFDIFFTLLGSIVVAYFSRYREFEADKGGAKLAGRDSMVAALENLRRTISTLEEDDRGGSLASLKISGRERFMALFSTHPPLEERILALKQTTLR